MAYLKVKRTMDLILSVIGLIALLPLYIGIAIAIKVDSKGPVIFKQKRYGKGKKTFNMLKFRTMHISAPKDAPKNSIDNPDKYITRIGKLLRRNSLDELPQLWNILMGEMSFVGPRPVVLSEIELIAERDKYGANDVRPGLTGWAQINGRDELTTKVKAKLDGDYVNNMSFKNDLTCLLKTIPVVLKKIGFAEGCTSTLGHQEVAAAEAINHEDILL